MLQDSVSLLKYFSVHFSRVEKRYLGWPVCLCVTHPPQPTTVHMQAVRESLRKTLPLLVTERGKRPSKKMTADKMHSDVLFVATSPTWF